jgi:hypothetical protein
MNVSQWQPRPQFANAEDWLAHYLESKARGKEPWPPETRDELMALNDAWPQAARCHKPAPPWDSHLGLPGWFGKEPQPYDEFERKRLLKTLGENKTFARAVVVLLKEAMRDE